MTASFVIGMGNAMRIDSVMLNAKRDTCEMQIQAATYPWGNDAGDFKKRVDESLANQQPSQPAAPARPESPSK